MKENNTKQNRSRGHKPKQKKQQEKKTTQNETKADGIKTKQTKRQENKTKQYKTKTKQNIGHHTNPALIRSSLMATKPVARLPCTMLLDDVSFVVRHEQNIQGP